MAREICKLEAQVLESTYLKGTTNLLRGPPALHRVSQSCLAEAKHEAAREVDPLAPRHARQLLLHGQACLVSRLRSEAESALMMVEEGHGRALAYRDARNWLLQQVLAYVQGSEILLAGQRDKLCLRCPGFGASMVQSLHSWSVLPAALPARPTFAAGNPAAKALAQAQHHAQAQALARAQEDERRRLEVNRRAWAAQVRCNPNPNPNSNPNPNPNPNPDPYPP